MTAPKTPPNVIRRGLREIIEPGPSQSLRKKMYQAFGGKCAFCGDDLPETGWDCDHLIPAKAGGTNHAANRVPACKDCNEHKRREKPWKEFLREKSKDQTEYDNRLKRIEEWTDAQGNPPEVPRNLDSAWKRCSDAAVNAYEAALKDLRGERDKYKAEQKAATPGDSKNAKKGKVRGQ